MSKRSSKRKKKNHKSQLKIEGKVAINNKVMSILDFEGSKPGFWKPFEEYNQTDPLKRAEKLQELGVTVNGEDQLGILTKSHFAIPGKTRFQCQNCGECCRYAKKVATLTYEPCPYLGNDNKCLKHDDRYDVCKWFPFWLYKDRKYGYILTVKPYCSGYGKGEVIDYREKLNELIKLRSSSVKDPDGAFVIHEMLYLPTQKRWVFPSKKNIDELMKFIAKQRGKNIPETKKRNNDHSIPCSCRGELEHARNYTCGLLCRPVDPCLTVDEKGNISDLNEAFENLCGKEKSTVVGIKFSHLFIEPERVEHDLLECLSKGRVKASPHKIQRNEGNSVPVLLNGVAYRDRKDGMVHGTIICISQISPSAYTELIQSRNYARALLDSSIDYLVVIDREGFITDVNKAAVEVSGYQREQLLGSQFCEYFDDQNRAKQGVEITISNGLVKDYELGLKTKDGRIIPVSFNATVFNDAEGNFQGLFASARDISGMKKMIRRLEEAHNYARGLIESSPDLMVTINSNGIITDVNEAAVNMTGVMRNLLVGSRFSEYFTDMEKAEEGVKQAFALGKVMDYKLDLKNIDGEVSTVTFDANHYRDTKGDVMGIFAVARKVRN